MKKLNAVTIVLLIVGLLCVLMVGCGGESPESLFGTAQFEEKQTNFTHAKELYQQIIREHPDSEWAKKAKERFKALQDLYPEN
ncbi:MAG: tetratricopeptide repeat protein [Nitrospirota bacterium]|nr:tetratricopeptide repeat protein [Nitrospirota bacterium]